MEILKTEKERIFKQIKDLDTEIRTIEKTFYDDNSISYIVDVGLLESLGEQGDIYTLIYDNKPTEEEIIKDSKEQLKKYLKDLKSSCMTAREEEHLKALNKIKDLK